MSEQKKIAFVCHPYHRGGVTRWMADAAIAYAANNYEVYFVAPEPSVEFFSGKGRETMVQLLRKTRNNVRVGTMMVGREFEFGLPEYCAYIYRKLILDNVPLGTPLIISDDKTVWQSATDLSQSYPVVGVLHADESAYYELAKKFNHKVAAFVCVAERVNKTVKKLSPEIDAKKIFTVPCGIDLPSFTQEGKQNNILQILYVGRITHFQKRAGDLTAVAELLKAAGISFQLTIIGDGDAKKGLEQFVKEKNLGDCVSFTGWLTQAQVHDKMVAADVLLLVSDFEGMPVSMMEALAAGCGFLGTRVSGIEDFEHHPLAKDCFRVFDVGALGEAVQKVKELAAIPVGIRRPAARQLAESEFSMQHCLNNYNAAIATIPAQQYKASVNTIGVSTRIKSGIIANLRLMKMKRTIK